MDQRKVIALSHIRKITGQQTRQQRVKSVPTPNAQTTTLCDGHIDQEALVSRILGSMELIKQQSLVCYYIACIQFGFGLRISEVLNIRPWDITSTGHVRIKALKGSFDRIIFVESAKDYLLKCKSSGKYPFAEFDRFFLYRLYKKVGLSHRFGNNSKDSVTHIFRHLASLSAHESGFDLQTRANQLGHKSTKSTQHYGK